MKAWKGKLLRNSLKKRFHIKDYIKAKRPRSPVRIIQNDWINRKEAISLTLRSEIRNAKSSITIMASYFIPGARIRRLLRKAAARNVKIRMILPGISDVNIVRNATLWLYTWMARHNFEIYEWDKTILHGKIAAIDDKWVSIGSYNINHLSDYASVETNAELRETGICRQINDELHNVISHCQKISKDGVERKLTPLVQFKCWLSYYIARGLFFFEYAVMSKE